MCFEVLLRGVTETFFWKITWGACLGVNIVRETLWQNEKHTVRKTIDLPSVLGRPQNTPIHVETRSVTDGFIKSAEEGGAV